MKKRMPWCPLLKLYASAYWRTGLLSVSICAIFLILHVLGFGDLREARYALILAGAVLLASFLNSFVHFAGRQMLLWQTLQHLPDDPKAIPNADHPIEDSFRSLAEAYGQLYQQQMAQLHRLDGERTDYYTLWVHQIKTPIAALGLIAQSEKPMDREQLKQEIFKIEQYADAALSYQRLTSLRNDLELTSVPLYALCCKAAQRFRFLFSCRKIRLQLEPFEGSVISDAKWLGMVVEQVLSNALKYTPEGGLIAITSPENGVLCIADTGIGIRPEDVPRVFDRGFTGYTGRESGKSTGIGLYLCRQTFDLLGHSISLQSTPGKGTFVTLNLQRESTEDF